MKKILLFSVAANLALGAWVGWALNSRAPIQPSATAAVTGTSSSAKSGRADGQASLRSDSAVETAPVSVAFNWKNAESPDYKEYIANLRAIGCPDKTIRDIIKADIGKLYAAKFKDLKGSNAPVKPYWKQSSFQPPSMDEELMKKQRALVKEKKEFLEELLGKGSVGFADMFDNTSMSIGNSQFDFLPDEKASAIQALQLKMAMKLMKYAGNGTPDQDDMKEMLKVQQQMETDIAKLLTPEEKVQYDLRNSNTAGQLRMMADDMNWSEAEYLSIFRLRKPFDDEFTRLFPDMSDPKKMQEWGQQRAQAEKELNDKIRGALGDQRFEEYQRNQDFAYSSMSRLVRENNLPRESAIQVHEIKKVSEAEVQRLNQDSTLTAEQRALATQDAQNKAVDAVKKIVGEKVLTDYQNQGAAYWLGLKPDPKKQGIFFR